MLFRSADAFVLPSRHESFGVVCIEALATGLPVLATRCGGPEDIVDDTNGVLVPIENSHALAEGLERVMLQEWDSTAIRTVFLHRYSTRAVSTAIRQLYDSVLSVV